MKIKKILLPTIAGSALFVGGPVMAQTDWLEGWSGSASLGALFTSGNSDTTNINASANVSKQIGLWRHTAFGSTYSAEDNDVDSADRFDLGYKVDRQFNETWYGFGRLRYDQDDFGNIDSRITGVAGVGNRFFDDGKRAFSAEIGIGAHQTDFIEDPDLSGATVADEIDPVTGAVIPVVTAGSDDGGVVFYAGANYSNIISENLVYNSVLSIEAAEVNTLIVWDNSFNVLLSDRISLSLGLLTRTNTDIGDNFDSTDTVTRVNIVYGI